DICPNNYDPAQDLSSDVLSCGMCGVVCAAAHGTPGCYTGVCAIASCDNGWSDCDGQYADGCEYDDQGFTTDPSNCGGCGAVCAFAHAGAPCVGGACVLGACAAGFSDCDGIAADGCEYPNTGFTTDPNNCGSCGHKCATGLTCQGGSCVATTCPAGFSDCDGLPANGCEYNNGGFTTDPNNCGACNVHCAPAHRAGHCVGGVCGIPPCNAGLT